LVAVLAGMTAVYLLGKSLQKVEEAEEETLRWKQMAKTYDSSIALELATNQEIIQEFRKRPNNQFLLLIPSMRQTDVTLDTHIANIPANAVLPLLRMAYDGVVDQIKEQSPGDELEQEEDWT